MSHQCISTAATDTADAQHARQTAQSGVRQHPPYCINVRMCRRKWLKATSTGRPTSSRPSSRMTGQRPQGDQALSPGLMRTCSRHRHQPRRPQTWLCALCALRTQNAFPPFARRQLSPTSQLDALPSAALTPILSFMQGRRRSARVSGREGAHHRALRAQPAARPQVRKEVSASTGDTDRKIRLGAEVGLRFAVTRCPGAIAAVDGFQRRHRLVPVQARDCSPAVLNPCALLAGYRSGCAQRAAMAACRRCRSWSEASTASTRCAAVDIS